jgi:hypothetical protein
MRTGFRVGSIYKKGESCVKGILACEFPRETLGLFGAFRRGLGRFSGLRQAEKNLRERPGKASNLAATPYTKPKFPLEMLYKVEES